MILLDTDMMSLFASGHPAVVARVRTATELVAITIVTRIKILQGRFDFLLKAANEEQLQRAQSWLEQSERDLAKIPIVAIDRAAALPRQMQPRAHDSHSAPESSRPIPGRRDHPPPAR